MLKYLAPLFAVAFIGGLVTGKSAFGATTANAGTFHSETSEQECLANNIYWEARNQPAKGMIGVALVTRNRVNDDRFPHSYCEVVQQGPTRSAWHDINIEVPIKHRCQFSWYCDGKSDVPKNEELFQDILVLTNSIVDGSIKILDITEGATHYHADYVRPAWAETKTKTIEIPAC